MTDHQFLVELRIRAYIDQIDGYPLGHPSREYFSPIVPTLGGETVNREGTLALPCYHNFTDEERAKLEEGGS